MRRFKFRLSHSQVASEWRDEAQTCFSATSFAALSVCHTSLGKARGLGESKEVPQLNVSPPKPYSWLTAGKVNTYRGISRKRMWRDRQWELQEGREGCEVMGTVDSVPSFEEERRFSKTERKGAAALEKGQEEGKQWGWMCRKEQQTRRGHAGKSRQCGKVRKGPMEDSRVCAPASNLAGKVQPATRDRPSARAPGSGALLPGPAWSGASL